MRVFSISLSVILVLLSSHAAALAGNESPLKDVVAWIDLRGAYTDADREWLDGGFSKTRYGNVDGEGWDGEIAEATLAWTPTFNAAWSGHFHFQTSPDQDLAFGPVETFLRYRILPKNGWRLSAKAGRFFPLVSLEHDGPAWSLTRTITPSAINSWIGEEVAIAGGELRAARLFGDHHIDLRMSAFGYNDTAGTLLAYRGWSLHDAKTMIGGEFLVPDRDDRRAEVPAQAARTRPFKEVDGKAGFYGAARWRYSDVLTLLISSYDNRADPEALEDGQYGWATRFDALGIKYEPSRKTEILFQVMAGETAMGPRSAVTGKKMFDVRYDSAYILIHHEISEMNSIAGRLDLFRTEDEGFTSNPIDETGSAATLSWLTRLTDNLHVGVETMYLRHNGSNNPLIDRDIREFQLQTQFKLSL